MSPESAGGLAEVKQSAVQTPCALKALEAQRRSDGERIRGITYLTCLAYYSILLLNLTNTRLQVHLEVNFVCK